MNIPEWLKPALYGAAAGAAALAFVGFSWGGWMTSASADKMASDHARQEVVAALVPICLLQSAQDPQVTERLAHLETVSSYQRINVLMEAGWATMPGSDDANRDVARSCVEQLAARF
jgi:hypothetical protein